MRILVSPADAGGCGYYRLMFAAEHLKMLGHDITIVYPLKGGGFDVKFEDNVMTDFMLPYEDIDIVVMQRISHPWHVQLIPLMRKKGIAAVIDIDDDLSAIHPGNSAFHTYRHRNTSTPFSYVHAAEACKVATYVTVSTKRLLGTYVRHGRGQILDNYVPERYLYIEPAQPHENPRFGWAGSVDSHPADLGVCGRATQELIDMGHEFRVIGPQRGIADRFKLRSEPTATGPVKLTSWPMEIANNIDVGMAPLEISAFNGAKSRLKPLEYNSLGIPYVGSPRDEYRRYHKESGGAGLLADSPREWVKSIDTLMKNEVMRKELGEMGRSFVANGNTVEQNSWRFLEAWTRALEIERGTQL